MHSCRSALAESDAAQSPVTPKQPLRLSQAVVGVFDRRPTGQLIASIPVAHAHCMKHGVELEFADAHAIVVDRGADVDLLEFKVDRPVFIQRDVQPRLQCTAPLITAQTQVGSIRVLAVQIDHTSTNQPCPLPCGLSDHPSMGHITMATTSMNFFCICHSLMCEKTPLHAIGNFQIINSCELAHAVPNRQQLADSRFARYQRGASIIQRVSDS